MVIQICPACFERGFVQIMLNRQETVTIRKSSDAFAGIIRQRPSGNLDNRKEIVKPIFRIVNLVKGGNRQIIVRQFTIIVRPGMGE